MTNKQFNDFLKDVIKILENSETVEQAIEKIKDKYEKR